MNTECAAPAVSDDKERQTQDKNRIVISFLSMIPKYNSYFYSTVDLREHDLTKTQLRTLFIVHMYPDITMSDLADQIATSREQATRSVTPLVKRGLLTRAVDKENRRQLRVRMTDEGERFIYMIVSDFIRSAGKPFQSLSLDELEDFHTAVKTISDTLNKVFRLKHDEVI